MRTLRQITSLTLLALPLAFAACDAEDPTEGDEQNQTDTTWRYEQIAAGPNPMDATGLDRVAVTTAPDGTVVVAYTDASRHLTIATQTSNGWKPEVVKGDVESGLYASLAYAADGSLHVVHYDRGIEGLLDSSRAPGATAWTHTTISADGGENELVRGADGTLHLLFLAWDQATKSDALAYARLVNGAWAVEPLGSGTRFNSPALTVDAAGVPHAIAYQWADDSLDTGNLVLADRSSGSWKSEALALPASYASDILVEGSVTHVVYAAPDEKGAIHVQRDGSGAWSTPETVIPFGGWDPDIERGTDGALQVLVSSEGRIHHATQGADGTWTRSRVHDGSRGDIEPRFVPGKDRQAVFTDRYGRSFGFIRFQP